MKQTTHVDHSPTLVYDISIDTDDTISLVITNQDPKFTAWLKDAPFTKGPLCVRSSLYVSLLDDKVFLCGSSSDIGNGIRDTMSCSDTYEYVNKVNVSIAMAIAAFQERPPFLDKQPAPISVGPYKISWDNMCKDLEQIGFHFGEVVIFENAIQRLFAYDPVKDILYMDCAGLPRFYTIATT